MIDATELAALRAEDGESRRLAQQDFVRPLVIEAGAGTGKTATLVGRVLGWCLGPGWERAADAAGSEDERVAERVLRGVVAITFTEAAAAEMDSRVEAALAALESGDRPAGFLGEAPLERVRALRGALDHLVVHTIHAYCRRLLASHPLEAGLHPRFEVDAEETAQAIAVREVLEERLAEGYTREDPGLLELAAKGHGPREIEEQLLGLLGAGISATQIDPEPLSPRGIGALRERLDVAHRDLDRAAAGRLDDVTKGTRAPAVAAALRAARSALDVEPHDAAGLERLRDALARAWDERSVRALRDWERSRFGSAEQAALGERVVGVAEAAGPLRRLVVHVAEIDTALLARATGLLRSLLGEVEERLRRGGHVTFGGLLNRTAALLTGSPAVAERIRAGIDQLLVDEFQDTDPCQCAILGALALEGPAEDRPGLFLVGDPKQSIYGWRSADLAAYEAFVERVLGTGGDRRSLTVNYRSVPAILDEVERVLAPVMLRRPGVQPAFERLVPSEKRESASGFDAGDFAPVEHWMPAEADDDGLCKTSSVAAAGLEARALAVDLRELHDVHGVSWGGVGVLFRSRGDWEIYLGALREAGVPFHVERDRSYYRRREILDATAWVRCILDPNDHLALLAVLRSAVVGVPDAALIPLWQHELPARWGRLGPPDAAARAELTAVLEEVVAGLPDGVPGLARVAGWEHSLLAAGDAIAGLRRSFELDPADLFVERLRSALAFEATEAARFLGAWRVANLERFFVELARSLSDESDPQKLLRRLRHAVSEDDQLSEEPVVRVAEDAVSILTLHGAKGLDFDHVYLMQTHKEGAKGRRAAVEVGDVDGRLEARLCGVPSLGFDALAEKRRRVEEAEQVRTLYVGMTRARDRLVVCGLPSSLRKVAGASNHASLVESRRGGTPDWSQLAREVSSAPRAAALHSDVQWSVLARRGTAAEPPGPVEIAGTGDFSWIEPGGVADAAVTEPRMRRPLGAAVSALAKADPSPPAAGQDGPGSSLGARVGSAIHRALEELDLAADPAAERDRLAGRIETWVRAGAPDASLEDAASVAAQRWQKIAAGDLIARLRSLAEHVVARELPVLLPPADSDEVLGFVAGAIDLVYRDPDDGGWVVVDYKTDAVTTAEAATRRRERYSRQGAAYQRALQEALGLGAIPRFELWWLLEDRIDVVDADAQTPRTLEPPTQIRLTFGRTGE